MTTDERFDALEKTVGRHRIAIAALVLVVVAAALTQSKDAVFNKITAKTFLIHNAAGERQAVLTADEDGGDIRILNKTGEEVVQIHVDEYGNGYVGAFNRKGMGKTLQPGN